MGRISEETLQRVRDATDLAHVVESYGVRLRQTGGNLVGLCPFHNEKTPSFNVNPQRQIFKCFGCGVAGDAIKFLQLIERLEFTEAVQSLAERAGITIERDQRGGDGPAQDGPESTKALRWANGRALAYFEAMYREPGEGQAAREYLTGRGFTDETIATWRLGWAPERWDGLVQTLVREGGIEKRQQILQAGTAAGILRRREDGGAYDAFRGRVMFPILDAQNRPVGFGGRVLVESKEAGGKYINTAEGHLFQKRKLLFGMGFAAREIGRTREAVIVEGYTDTIMCHQYGIRNAVATLGTSLTREHIQLLRRYVCPDGHVTAMFDSDEAGARATRRAIELFMEEDVPLRIVRGLEVKDACDFLPRHGAEAFRERLGKAVEAFDFALQETLSAAGNDMNGTTAAVTRLMELVNRSPNPVRRALMRRKVAEATGVPEEALPAAAPRRRGDEAPVRRGLGPSGAPTSEPALHGLLLRRQRDRRKMELRLLRYMMENADWSARASDRVPPDHLRCGACRDFAAALRDSWLKGGRLSPEALRNSSRDENAGEIHAEICMGPADPPLEEEDFRALLDRLEQEDRQADLTEEVRDARDDLDEVRKALARKASLQDDLNLNLGFARRYERAPGQPPR